MASRYKRRESFRIRKNAEAMRINRQAHQGRLNLGPPVRPQPVRPHLGPWEGDTAQTMHRHGQPIRWLEPDLDPPF